MNPTLPSVESAITFLMSVFGLALVLGCSPSVNEDAKGFSNFEAVLSEIQASAKAGMKDRVQIAVSDDTSSEPSIDATTERIVKIVKKEQNNNRTGDVETTFSLRLKKTTDRWVCTSAKSFIVRGDGTKGETSIQGKGIELKDLLNWMRL